MSTPAIRAISALPLLVARILADDHDPSMTTDHFAFFTHRFDAGSYLHGGRPFFLWISGREVDLAGGV
jgi:hypothetical protein